MSNRRILPFAATTATRRWWLGLGLAALLFAQALGLAHRVAHGGLPPLAQLAMAHGQDDAFGHSATKDCRLFDQAGLADLAWADPDTAVGAPAAAAPPAHHVLPRRCAAPVAQRARGPPAQG